MKRRRDTGPGGHTDTGIDKRLVFVTLSPCLLVILSFCLAGCAKPDPEVERRAAVEATLAKLWSCAPESKVGTESVQLGIVGVTRQPNETGVRLVAYALAESVDFDLPVYSLSRGRWLINERSRAYLLDEQCREYKLNGQKLSAGQERSAEGKVKLEAGQAVEVLLSFPPLSDNVRMGWLVYGGRVLPFTLLQPTVTAEGR